MAVRQQLRGTFPSQGRREIAAADAPAGSGGHRFVAAALPSRQRTPWPRRSPRALAIRVAAVAAPPERESLMQMGPDAFSGLDLVIVPAAPVRHAACGPVATTPAPDAPSRRRGHSGPGSQASPSATSCVDAPAPDWSGPGRAGGARGPARVRTSRLPRTLPGPNASGAAPPVPGHPGSLQNVQCSGTQAPTYSDGERHHLPASARAKAAPAQAAQAAQAAPVQAPQLAAGDALGSGPATQRGVGGRPWTAMHARLQSHLRSTGLLAGVDSVLVAVSGGQDSVCLLQLLADLRHLYGWRRLGVVHCDHRWRPDSAANAAFVVELATRRLGLASEDVHVEVAGPGQARCERSAREWRYGVFSRVAAECGYGAVLTAHTSTDRAETMMLNLLRGAGPSGLVALSRNRPLPPPPFTGSAASRFQPQPSQAAAQRPLQPAADPLTASARLEQQPGEQGACGSATERGTSSATCPDAPAASTHCTCSTGSCMCGGRGSAAAAASAEGSGGGGGGSGGGASGPVRLVRPLLPFTRAETQAFVQQSGLPHYHDSTNDCNDHRRNRLRNDIMPQLRAGFNPRLDLALTRFMDVMEPEVEFVESMAGLAYSRVCEPEADVAGPGHSGAGAPTAAGAAAVGQANRECGARAAGVGAMADNAAEAAASRQEALRLAALRKLPLALQRRVLHTWLARELSRRRSLRQAQSPTARTVPDWPTPTPRHAGADADEHEAAALGASASGAAAAAAASKCVEVGFEDVARCLPLVTENPPQGAVSDQLCGSLVAVVDGEWLRLRAARELADWQRQLQARRRKEQWEQREQKLRAARAQQGRVVQEVEETEQPSPAAQRVRQLAAAAGADVRGLAVQYVWRLHRMQQETSELEELERQLLGRLGSPLSHGEYFGTRPGARSRRSLLQELLEALAARDSSGQLQRSISEGRAIGDSQQQL